MPDINPDIQFENHHMYGEVGGWTYYHEGREWFLPGNGLDEFKENVLNGSVLPFFGPLLERDAGIRGWLGGFPTCTLTDVFNADNAVKSDVCRLQYGFAVAGACQFAANMAASAAPSLGRLWIQKRPACERCKHGENMGSSVWCFNGRGAKSRSSTCEEWEAKR